MDIAARGRSKVCAGVERKEYPPFARKYAAMGLGLMVPYKSIWSLQLFGVTAAAIPFVSPRSLEEARISASKLLARHATRADQAQHGAAARREGQT
jgi:hypothetical protein